MVKNNSTVNPLLWYMCKYCGRFMQPECSLVEHKKREHQQELRAEKSNNKIKTTNHVNEGASRGEKPVAEEPKTAHLQSENPSLKPVTGQVEKIKTMRKAVPEGGDEIQGSILDQEPAICNTTIDHSSKNCKIREKVPISFLCPFCNRMFRTAGAYAMHKKTHKIESPSIVTHSTPISETTEDSMGAQKSSQSSSLPFPESNSNKNNNRDPAIYQYPCSHCGKRFMTKQTKIRHEIIHTGQKLFLCEICGRRLARLEFLKAHQRIHTGERPYKCKVCSKTFSIQSNLINHVNYVHLHKREKKHRCKQGNATYGRKAYLRSHMAKQGLIPGRNLEAFQKIRCHRSNFLSFRCKVSFNDRMVTHGVANVQKEKATLETVNKVSIDHPVTRKVVNGNTKMAACGNSREPTQTQSYLGVIQQEFAAGVVHYTCTVCLKIFWYRSEAEAHAHSHRAPHEA